MTSVALIVAALTVSFQAPGFTPPQTKGDVWKLAQAEDGSFSVEMPAAFKVNKDTLQGQERSARSDRDLRQGRERTLCGPGDEGGQRAPSGKGTSRARPSTKRVRKAGR